MSNEYRFFVSGIPRPQGSKSFVRGRVIEASKHVYQWRRDIASLAQEVITSPPLDNKTPVAISLKFCFARPKSHVTRKGELRSGFSPQHIQRPDVDKLSRAVLDALTGIAWQDDSQVISLTATKVWGAASGVEIRLSPV